MRALILATTFASGCSLLFDGGDLHGTHRGASDMAVRSSDMMVTRPGDLAGTTPDMQHTLAFAAHEYAVGGCSDVALGHFHGGTGAPDAVTIGHGVNMIFVLGNDGHGSFSLSSTKTACTYGTQPGKPYNVVATDFDADGKDDAAFTCNDTAAGQDHVDVLLGDGAGGLTKAGGLGFNAGTPQTSTTGNFNAVGLASGDFNGDGKRDLLVAYNLQDNADLFTGSGGTPLSFSAGMGIQLTTGSQSASAVAADIDGNGYTDAVLANSKSAPVLKASKPFTGFTVTNYFPDSMYPGGVGTAVLGALTAGGRPDLLTVVFDNVAMMPGNQIQILRNDGDGNFPGTPQVVSADPSTAFIVVADFDGDGQPDIAWNSSDLGHVSIAIQKPDHDFKNPFLVTVPTAITQLIAADVDGDGRPDILCGHNDPNMKGLVVLLNRST